MPPTAWSGLETALGLALELVHRGVISPARMVELMSLNPARSCCDSTAGTLAECARADITVIDPNLEWTVDPAKFLSKSRNSPFAGQRVEGQGDADDRRGRDRLRRQTGRAQNERTARSDTGAGRRPHLSRPGLRRGRRDRRRSRVQHRDDRLPGGADRSVVQGADRLHDLPGDRQRRNQRRRRGVGARYVEGFMVKEYRSRPSNWRSEMSLGEYLERAGVAESRASTRARWCATSAPTARRRR